MAGPGAGFEYPPQEVSWLKRDVLLFANSIGCTSDELHFLFELHPKFQVFPTYSIILPFKQTDQEVIDFYARQGATPIPGVPKFDSRRVVDGQRLIRFLKPLPPTSAGKRFELRTRIIGVYDKGKAGSVVEQETVLAEKGGDVYTKAVGSAFFVGQGNWGGPKGPSTTNFPPPEGKQPDAVYTLQTTRESALLYRLNGDYNPLHATPEPGQKMGFGGVIMHGLFSWNTTCHGLLLKLGGSDPANIKEFQARFAAPVKPGDKLITEIWRTGDINDGWEEIRFVTRVEGGKVVLSNGRASMRHPQPPGFPEVCPAPISYFATTSSSSLLIRKMSVRQKALRSITRPCKFVQAPTPRLVLLPHKTQLSTIDTPKPQPSRPQKPEQVVPPTVSSGLSLQELGASRGVRIVVLACLSVFATMESIFYVQAARAYFWPAREVESGFEGK
ncbi:hypothetical protein MMC26_001880 [Xylographa opegraphella]|nr:hypothetical protein [Xylographa opegraphella]